MKKLGICTGGGDCPGLNAAIRAVVKHAKNTYNIEVVGIHDSFTGLQTRPVKAKTLEYIDVADILHKGGTILGTFNKSEKYSTQEGQEKVKLAVEAVSELGLDAVIAIGGEGTQTMASYLHEAGVPMIGIPKTIDNDLPDTEQTIGFSTCIDLVSDSVKRLQSTAESHDRVMILEVMGRDSGYIALHGGIAGGANIILIPEIPYSYEAICNKIAFRQSLGRNYSLIVISEGAYPSGEEPLYKASTKGRKNLGGIGQHLAQELGLKTKTDTRVTVLGHLQRGGQPNTSDKILANQFAIHAVDLFAQGKTGRIVVMKENKLSDISYNGLTKYQRRKIPADDGLLRVAESIGTCLGR